MQQIRDYYSTYSNPVPQCLDKEMCYSPAPSSALTDLTNQNGGNNNTNKICAEKSKNSFPRKNVSEKHFAKQKKTFDLNQERVWKKIQKKFCKNFRKSYKI